MKSPQPWRSHPGQVHSWQWCPLQSVQSQKSKTYELKCTFIKFLLNTSNQATFPYKITVFGMFSVARGRQGTFQNVGVYDSLWFLCLQIDITYKRKL